MFLFAILIYFLNLAHQSQPNLTTSPADFSRHINLHLTYSFQQHQQTQQQAQLSPVTCKSPTPSLYQNHGEKKKIFYTLYCIA